MGFAPRLLLACTALFLLLAGPAAGAPPELPPITDQERSLTQVPGHPNAPAVVLFRKGTFSMIDPVSHTYRPTFTVTVRRKILTEEGKRYGEVVLQHSRWAKLRDLQARTVLPDGRILPVAENAIFRRRTSQKEKIFETSIAFPAVEVGAILDYRYQVRLDSPFQVEPWTFQEEVPTLFSEIVYDTPDVVAVSFWSQNPLGVAGLKQSVVKTGSGSRITVSGANLPAVPSEPYSPAFNDLAARFYVIPVEIWTTTGQKKADLFRTWQSACTLMSEGYEKFLRKSALAERRAREIAEKVGPDRRARAEALYRLVRDEIETGDGTGIMPSEGSTADAVLNARTGLPTEKALLLRSLLSDARISAHLVWAPERGEGMVNLNLSTPFWFDRAIVAVDLDGQRVFLDPSDRTLAFGRLPPSLEGMPAILYDPKAPEEIRLPATPYEENLRHARIELDLDAAGRLTGHGTLRLAGQHAWSRLGWQPDAAHAAEAWEKWLTDNWEGFDIGDLQVTEDIEAGRVEVTWTLKEREEEVLGDESSLSPSRPLGPASQPFQVPADRRVTPVFFPFPDRDEVELTLRWPEGWKLETLPRELRHESPVGAAVVTVELDEAHRSLTYHRRFDVQSREYSKEFYGALQSLFGAVERSDAEAVVLRRR
jgi:Domain of Unknown Function with PDB structure (DUF3857)